MSTSTRNNYPKPRNRRNRRSLSKLVVGRWFFFPFGMAYVQRRVVRFREDETLRKHWKNRGLEDEIRYLFGGRGQHWQMRGVHRTSLKLTHEVPRQKSGFFPQIMSHGSGKCWPNLSKKGTFLLQIFSIWGEIPPLPPKSCECYICWDPKTARPQCFRCLTVDFRFFLSKNTDPMCFPCFVPFFLD